MAMKLFDAKSITIPVRPEARKKVQEFLSQHVTGTGLNTNQSIDKSVLDEIRALSAEFEIVTDGQSLRCSYPSRLSRIWALLERGSFSWPSIPNLDQTIVAFAVGSPDEL